MEFFFGASSNKGQFLNTIGITNITNITCVKFVIYGLITMLILICANLIPSSYFSDQISLYGLLLCLLCIVVMEMVSKHICNKRYSKIENMEGSSYEFEIPDRLTVGDLFSLSNRHMENTFGFHIKTLPIDAKLGERKGGSICK